MHYTASKKSAIVQFLIQELEERILELSTVKISVSDCKHIYIDKTFGATCVFSKRPNSMRRKHRNLKTLYLMLAHFLFIYLSCKIRKRLHAGSDSLFVCEVKEVFAELSRGQNATCVLHVFKLSVN